MKYLKVILVMSLIGGKDKNTPFLQLHVFHDPGLQQQ
jgi:hypothetical protein